MSSLAILTVAVGANVAEAKPFAKMQGCTVTSNRTVEKKGIKLGVSPKSADIQSGAVRFQQTLLEVERERPRGVGGTHEVLRVMAQPLRSAKGKREFSSSFGPVSDLDRQSDGFPKQIEATAKLEDGAILFVRCPLTRNE